MLFSKYKVPEASQKNNSGALEPVRRNNYRKTKKVAAARTVRHEQKLLTDWLRIGYSLP